MAPRTAKHTEADFECDCLVAKNKNAVCAYGWINPQRPLDLGVPPAPSPTVGRREPLRVWPDSRVEPVLNNLKAIYGFEEKKLPRTG